MGSLYYESSLAHYGRKGMKWGIRNFQNPDGTLTDKGRKRYLNPNGTVKNRARREIERDVNKLINKNPSLINDLNASWDKVSDAEKPMVEFLKSPDCRKYASEDKILDMFADIDDGVIKYDKGPYRDYAKDHKIDYDKMQKRLIDAHENFNKATVTYVNNVIKEYRGTTTDSIKLDTAVWKQKLDPIDQEIRISALNFDLDRDWAWR